VCKKFLSLILIGLILNLAFYSTARANPNLEKESKFALKVKTAVTKLGVGQDARIEVKLRDKTKIKGYVDEVRENSFVVVDEKTNTATEIPYLQAKQVKGKNNLTGAQIAIGVFIVALIVIGVLYGLDKIE
jgi:hypothetical protein